MNRPTQQTATHEPGPAGPGKPSIIVRLSTELCSASAPAPMSQTISPGMRCPALTVATWRCSPGPSQRGVSGPSADSRDCRPE